MNKPLATKEQVANFGPYHKREVCNMARATGYFVGFDRIYETSKYILLIPPSQSDQGYFWIDKETSKGMRIPSSDNLNREAERAIEGKSIISVMGGNDRALISYINPMLMFLFVDKIIDAEGTLLVMTRRNEVFCFERNTGKLRCKIGTLGEGPEEYLHMAGCIYNPDEKVVGIIDAYKNKMLCYDLNGVFKYQKEIPVKVALISSAELSKNGYLMFSNNLNSGPGAKTFAYTVVAPDGGYFDFDPFSPVYVDECTTEFASRPMTVYGDGFTFQKFLNDTIFRLENGHIIPKYKLSMKKRIPSKELVAQIGPFNWVDIIKMCKSSGYFSGFGRIFETGRFILLEPMFPSDEGYFWIDKESEAGYRVPSTVNFSKELNLIIEGRSILSVKGSNSNELISCYEQTLSKNGFVRQMDENPDLVPFSKELRTFFENADPMGNPIVIIYEH